MQAEQLSVLDLPPDNVLGILPRFSVRGKDDDAIGQFANIINEIRLDQLEPELAGNGKSGKQLQPNLPIEIEVVAHSAATNCGDRETDSIEDNPEFCIGDRVTYANPTLQYQRDRGIGTITSVLGYQYFIDWEDFPSPCPHLKTPIDASNRLIKVEPENKFLENPNKLDSFPEIKRQDKTHGYLEHYSVIGKNDREYYYKRYVYQDISGKLRHHHISKKQTEAIATMWRSGASAKEICVALGKEYKSK